MADPFLGEIRMFTGNYAPLDWSQCDGQMVPIEQNPNLFALIGVFFGGDGIRYFQLPDLRGSLPVGIGTGAGLSNWELGWKQGSATVPVMAAHLNHSHALNVSTDETGLTDPNGNVLAQSTGGANLYSSSAAPSTTLNSASVSTAPGAGEPHSNMMPYQCVNYIICMNGLWPSRP